MIRSALGKVVWVGRATVFLVGLAVILALLFGVASTALAHKADRGLFHLGHTNAGKALSTLVGTLATPVLKVDNNGTGPALQLEAGNAAGTAPDTVAPIAVNPEAGTATGLSADELDGKDSAAYQKRVSSSCPQNSSIRVVNADGTVACESNAGNADKLDNKDSTVFGIRTDHATALAHQCDTSRVWNECAPVTVTVPDGKRYIVSVWSSFSAMNYDNSTYQHVAYCSAGKGPSIDANNPCITPFGHPNSFAIEGRLAAAASSGETLSLSPGSYTFFTAINPIAHFAERNDGRVITKVMVRDATNGL